MAQSHAAAVEPGTVLVENRDVLTAEDDVDGSVVWRRLLATREEILRKQRREGKAVY